MAKALDHPVEPLTHEIRLLMQAGHEATVGLAERLELGTTDVMALDLLDLEGPMGPALLARKLGIRTASATALVDRLEASGHVERVRDPDDRRRVAVVPTAKTQVAAITALAPMLERVDAVGRALSAADGRVILAYLAAATAALKASR